MVTSEEVKRFAREKCGADLVGIASAEVLNQKAPEGYRPKDVLPDAKSVIVVSKRWIRTLVDEVLPHQRQIYAGYMPSLTNRLDWISWQLAEFLEDSGYAAIPIPNFSLYMARLMGTLSHRHAAVEAGLGVIGVNNLLITAQYGPRQRLGQCLTNAELKPDAPLTSDLCKEMRPKCELACIKVCPVSALAEGKWTDKVRCSYHQDYQTPRFMREGTKTMQCGLCIASCPVGASDHLKTPAQFAKEVWPL
jgi:epoxyqueuosine reductase